MRLRHMIAASCSVLAVAGCGAIGTELSASNTSLPTPVTTDAVDTHTVVAEPTSDALPTSAAPAPSGETTSAAPTRAPKSITGCDYPYPNSTTYFSDGSTGWTRYCEQQMRHRIEADSQSGADCVGTVCHPDGLVPPGMGGSTAEDKRPVETPEVSAPETSTPETSTPETSTPETSTPETSTPETSNPETSTPETSSPETSTPETSNPESSSPETSTPETSTPETSTPTSETESANEPLVETLPAEDDLPGEPKPMGNGAQ